ncbi:MAG: hypothetical protein AB8B47_00705 [Roseobacter sp.]
MSWSASEITALAHKAARGAGAPPAQAERFGAVTALHLMAGRDATLLVRALGDLPSGPIIQYPVFLDACLLSGSGACVQNIQEQQLFQSYVDALPYAAHLDASRLKLVFDLTVPRAKIQPKRILGCEVLVQQLTDLAARTFVPESDTSRLAGAGAGLTDND